MALFDTSLQVLAAVTLVVLLFLIAYYMFQREALQALRQAKQLRNRVDIFQGVKDMALIQNGESYNTVHDNGGLFMDLKPSVNQAGGIEFAYNFWLYQDSGFQTSPGASTTVIPPDTGLNSEDIVLLLRGNNQAFSYSNVCGNPKTDVYIKCPLIKLENYGDSLTVEFNTIQSPDVVREGAKNMCRGISTKDWNQANAHKVSVRGLKNNQNFMSKWFMVTVIIQDTFPEDPQPFRNKVRTRIYIDGVLELDQYVDSKIGEVKIRPTVLQPNQGNLYIMPRIRISGTASSKGPQQNDLRKIMVADMSYFNYVLDADEIVSLYQDGFHKFYATAPKGSDPSSDVMINMSYTDGKTRQLQST